MLDLGDGDAAPFRRPVRGDEDVGRRHAEHPVGRAIHRRDRDPDQSSEQVGRCLHGFRGQGGDGRGCVEPGSELAHERCGERVGQRVEVALVHLAVASEWTARRGTAPVPGDLVEGDRARGIAVRASNQAAVIRPRRGKLIRSKGVECGGGRRADRTDTLRVMDHEVANANLGHRLPVAETPTVRLDRSPDVPATAFGVVGLALVDPPVRHRLPPLIFTA